MKFWLVMFPKFKIRSFVGNFKALFVVAFLMLCSSPWFIGCQNTTIYNTSGIILDSLSTPISSVSPTNTIVKNVTGSSEKSGKATSHLYINNSSYMSTSNSFSSFINMNSSSNIIQQSTILTSTAWSAQINNSTSSSSKNTSDVQTSNRLNTDSYSTLTLKTIYTKSSVDIHNNSNSSKAIVSTSRSYSMYNLSYSSNITLPTTGSYNSFVYPSIRTTKNINSSSFFSPHVTTTVFESAMLPSSTSWINMSSTNKPILMSTISPSFTVIKMKTLVPCLSILTTVSSIFHFSSKRPMENITTSSYFESKTNISTSLSLSIQQSSSLEIKLQNHSSLIQQNVSTVFVSGNATLNFQNSTSFKPSTFYSSNNFSLISKSSTLFISSPVDRKVSKSAQSFSSLTSQHENLNGISRFQTSLHTPTLSITHYTTIIGSSFDPLFINSTQNVEQSSALSKNETIQAPQRVRRNIVTQSDNTSSVNRSSLSTPIYSLFQPTSKNVILTTSIILSPSTPMSINSAGLKSNLTLTSTPNSESNTSSKNPKLQTSIILSPSSSMFINSTGLKSNLTLTSTPHSESNSLTTQKNTLRTSNSTDFTVLTTRTTTIMATNHIDLSPLSTIENYTSFGTSVILSSIASGYITSNKSINMSTEILSSLLSSSSLQTLATSILHSKNSKINNLNASTSVSSIPVLVSTNVHLCPSYYISTHWFSATSSKRPIIMKSNSSSNYSVVATQNLSSKSSKLPSDVIRFLSSTSYLDISFSSSNQTYIPSLPFQQKTLGSLSSTLKSPTSTNISNVLSYSEKSFIFSKVPTSIIAVTDISLAQLNAKTTIMIESTATIVLPSATPLTPIQDGLLLITLVDVARDVDVNSNLFKTNISEGLRRTYDQAKLLDVTRFRRNTNDNGKISTTEIKIESTDRYINSEKLVDVKFVVKENGSVVPAKTATKVFSLVSSQYLASQVGYKVAKTPAPVNQLTPSRLNYVKIVLKSPIIENILNTKLPVVYLTGNGTATNGQKDVFCIIGSVDRNDVVTTVIFSLAENNKLISSESVADTMNNVPIQNMSVILGYEVISKPEALLVPTADTTDNLRYWIIGAVIGGVLVLVLLFVLICWRWLKGGPTPTKTERTEGDMGAADQVDALPIHGNENETVQLTTKAPPVKEKETNLHISTKEISVPLFSENKHPASFTSDELRTSQRKKVQRDCLKPKGYSARQNTAYDPSVIDEEEEEDDDDYEEDDDVEEEESEDEPIQKRRLDIPPQRPPRNSTDGKRPPPSPARREEPMRRSPFYRNDKDDDVLTRKPLEMTGNVIRSDLQDTSFTADQIPTFNRVNEHKDYSTNQPIRFRPTVENIKNYSKLSGPLPLLDLQQTSLIGSTPVFKKPIDPEIQHKTEIERMRNKQRQRDQFIPGVRQSLTSTDKDSMTSSSKNERFNRSWRKEQEKINSILDPQTTDLSQRKGRLRRKLRRKNKISIAPLTPANEYAENRSSGDVTLKNYRMLSRSPAVSRSNDKIYDDDEDTEPMDPPSGNESEISMGEARRRIHDLLDDTFHTLKKYQKQIGGGGSKVSRPDIPSTTGKTQISEPGKITNIPIPFQQDRKQYSLKYPPAIQPFPPNTLPMQNMYPGPTYTQYPAYTDPLISWDPMERQRYVSQMLGYPGQSPVVGSLSMPYGNPNQNVYITPVQQRPDGMGGKMWNPYVVDNLPETERISSQIPGESSLRNYSEPPSAYNTTTIDLNDIGKFNKKRDSSSQPLIRAIKDELLKLSHSTQGKTKIQELRH